MTCRLIPHLFVIFSRCNKSFALEKEKRPASAQSPHCFSPNAHVIDRNLDSSSTPQHTRTAPQSPQQHSSSNWNSYTPLRPALLPLQFHSDPGHGWWQWANNWSAGDPSGPAPTSPAAGQLVLSMHSWCHPLLESYARPLVTWEKVPSAGHTLQNEAEFILAPGYYTLSHYPTELPYPRKGCVLPFSSLRIWGFLHLEHSGRHTIHPPQTHTHWPPRLVNSGISDSLSHPQGPRAQVSPPHPQSMLL